MNMIGKIASEEAGTRPSPAARFNKLNRWQKGGLIAAPLALLAAGATFANNDAPVVAAPPPPTVTVAQPLSGQINEWDDYVGRFEASQSVEVRPRVSGAVTAVHFSDGAVVAKGQLLFTLDSRPFAAALAEARAGLAGAQSELALANADLGRANRLLDVEAVSNSDVDRLQARVRAAGASLSAAQARVRARSLDMEFTQVRAPISGQISDRKVDAGNLVSAGEGAGGTLLTTINALDPIYFSFDGSEALFLKNKRAKQAGASASPVEVRLQDEGEYRWKGALDFTDNTLDPRSGTMRGRAVLRNPGLFLTPGMFGNMRLSSGGTTDALMVPDSSIQTDQARKMVLVVAADGSVGTKAVELGPLVNGLRIVRSGLAASDRVIISGTQMAMPGAKVQVRAGKIEPVAPSATPTVTAPTTGEATMAR
ncbi:MAG: efflux RND transporter periplasmic adaptor subunit [Sphingomonadales bacterium]|nr:MAG: efflux RND transporter periplasmic adaptor subunit [Sphingomonadales bacterium]